MVDETMGARMVAADNRALMQRRSLG